MVDPTSSLAEGIDPEEAPECVVCESPIVEDPGHRVKPRVEDGEVRTRHYCSEECYERD